MSLIELKFKNPELLKKKGTRLIKLKRNKEKNKVRFTEAFQNLLKDNGVKAILALKGDAFEFKNNFDDNKKISLTHEYGIKNGQFVQFRDIIRAKSVPVPTEVKEGFDAASNPNKKSIFVTSTNVVATETVHQRKSTRMKTEKMIDSIMKDTFDIEPIYNTWVSQLIEEGNKLAEDSSEYIDEDEEDFFEEDTSDELNEVDDEDDEEDEDTSAYAVDDDVALEEEDEELCDVSELPA